jgi:ankyrin repeat protein
METFLKLTSNKTNKNCNCISPFHINDISGINPNTNINYTSDELDVIKSTLYRISNARGCKVDVCCDPNDPFSSIDKEFMASFKKTYPKIMPVYNGNVLNYIKLSTTSKVKQSGWQDPSPYFVCKITKATINPTDDSTVYLATNLVQDCFTDSCNDVEKITINNLLEGSKVGMKEYTTVDDNMIEQAIKDGNIDAVKLYIRKYKKVDAPLTNNNYNNRMIHIAAMSKNIDILDMLIALKANLNIRNKFNETPLHFAVRSKNQTNINHLLNQNIDLTAKNNKGETPIFYAIKNSDLSSMRLLYNAGSGILVSDNNGNTLVHYCILNTPTPTDVNTKIVQTEKSKIIKFLIDRGVNTESKNNDGYTPLELSKQKLDKIALKKLGKDTNEVIDENFINTVRESFFGGALQQDTSEYTSEELSLLEIQTMLFNNVIKNNPDKFKGYINVKDLPNGSPIDVLDTVCVGGNNIGNEDSEQCIQNGGQIVKIKNKTTLLKLDLIPEEESIIDKLKQDDLYFKKIPNKVSNITKPEIIESYNKGLNLVVPTTSGMTYEIGSTSGNIQPIITSSNTNVSITNVPTTTTLDHPSILSEKDVQTSITEAIKNSKNNVVSTLQPVSNKQLGTDLVSYLKNHMWTISFIILLIILLIGYKIYSNFNNK